MSAIPVIEMGGTHVAGALVDASAAYSITQRADLALDSAEDADTILATIAHCVSSLDVPPGATWAVAIPGPFDYANGVAQFRDVGKFDSLYGLDIGRALKRLIGSRPGRIVFLNDADAFGLGEWVAGAARAHRRVLALTLGTGIGSAFLDNGVVVSNRPDVPPQGHVYLLEYAGLPVEETVSRRAIRANYAARTGASAAPDVRDIADRARDGDVAAVAVMSDTMSTLGRVLAPWVRRFEPSCIVVGGSMAGSWDLISGPLTEGLSLTPGQHVTVTRAANAGDAGLRGAAWRAAQAGPIDERMKHATG